MTDRPNLFLVGAPKSGTTSLHRYLQGHPEIYMTRYKEPGYFAPDVIYPRSAPRFRYPHDEGKYLALFSGRRAEAHLGESSTNYLLSRQAPQLIVDFQPAAKIIAMIRNPVDLVYSLHSERVSEGSEWITDFSAAIDADDDRRRGKRLQRGLHGPGVAYRDNAMLGDQIERWLDVIGSDRLHVVVFDDFIADTASEYAKVLSFIGVDAALAFSVPSSFYVDHNPTHRRRSGPVATVLRSPAARWLSRQGLPWVLGERRMSELARHVTRRRFTRRSFLRQPMSDELRAQLETEFASDVTKLGRLLNRDLKAAWFGNSGETGE